MDDPAVRVSRRHLLYEEITWRKSGLTSFFKPFVPKHDRVVSQLEVQLGVGTQDFSNITAEAERYGWLGWSRTEFPVRIIQFSKNEIVAGCDEWVVLTMVGVPNARNMALNEPLKSLRLPPIASLAYRLPCTLDKSDVVADDMIFAQPVPGSLFCAGGEVGIAGFPFHIDCPFIQV